MLNWSCGENLTFVTFTDHVGAFPHTISSAHRAVAAAPPDKAVLTDKRGHAAVSGACDWQQHRVLHCGQLAAVDHWVGSEQSKDKIISRCLPTNIQKVRPQVWEPGPNNDVTGLFRLNSQLTPCVALEHICAEQDKQNKNRNIMFLLKCFKGPSTTLPSYLHWESFKLKVS